MRFLEKGANRWSVILHSGSHERVQYKSTVDETEHLECDKCLVNEIKVRTNQ